MLKDLDENVLRVAAEICWEYGNLLGNRADEKPAKDILNAFSILQDDEKYQLAHQYQVYNDSDGDGGVPHEYPFDEGMMLSFAIARHLEIMLESIENGD
jgi:hypothetical protein